MATLLVYFAPVHCSLISVPLKSGGVLPRIDWLEGRLSAVPYPTAAVSDLNVAPVALAAVARAVDKIRIMGNPNKGSGTNQGTVDKTL